jgi:FkbH-like protein
MLRHKLPWLLEAPEDFRLQLKNIEAGNFENKLELLANLASFSLGLNQLHALAKVTQRIKNEEPKQLGRLIPLNIATLSNATTKLFTPSLISTALRYNISLSIIEGEYDQVLQQAIDSESPIHNCHYILIALDYRGIPGLSEDMVKNETAEVEKALFFFDSLYSGLKGKGETKLIFQTVAKPPIKFFGNSDTKTLGSRHRRIDSFNVQLSERVIMWNELLLDTAFLADSVGLDTWFDEVQWLYAKIPFSQHLMPLYADHCMRLVAAGEGRVRKCLVLDLDNTLWGGVIGDDGIEGIVIGNGSAQGEAYLSVQRMALVLLQRGIILAVCSKNNDDVALEVFRKHPEMLLREKDITIFLANWRDKASNLEVIAKTLNIGLDSLVFLDDNPVERQQVRDELPLVAVPELPEDSALYPLTISAGGYFENTNFSENDALRAEQYQANAKRALEAKEYRNLNDFLVSLNMEIVFAPFDAIGRARIAQLVQRSNQFNLTTKRYSEADITRWEENADAFTLQVRLADKYGDNGMISIVICKKTSTTWIIDTWLMSCRVLNRRVEEAILNELVESASHSGATSLIGIFRQTDRNSLVKDHYRNLGFEYSKQLEDQEEWTLGISTYQMKKLPMGIKRVGKVLQ